MGELFERWFAAASSDWSASTIRETRSLLRCHLIPHLGHYPVTKLSAVDIDDLYAHLRGGAAATVNRSHREQCTGSTSCCIVV